MQETEYNNPEHVEEYKTNNVDYDCFNQLNCLPNSFLDFNNFEELHHTNNDEEPVDNWLFISKIKVSLVINNVSWGI